MRDILLLAITVAAVIVIVRTIMYLPLMQKTIEAFVGGKDTSGSQLNAITECPPGAQIYMYEGTVYCCEGRVNPDADTLERSCKPASVTGDRMLCTLGPSRHGVINCLQTIGGQMQEKGQTICPPAMPNFCKGPTGSASGNGRCCAGQPNVGYTDCLSGRHCDVSGDEKGNIQANFFLDPTDCRFLRAKELEPKCPPKYLHSMSLMTSGPFSGLTLIGCSTGSANETKYCYSGEILGQLTALGYDVSSLNACVTVTP